MAKRFGFLQLATVVLCVIAGVGGSARASPYDAVLALVDRVRVGGDLRLQVQVSGETFVVMQERAGAIEQATFLQLVKGAKKPGLPALRFTNDATVVAYAVDDTTTVEEARSRKETGTKAQTSWTKREWIPVSTHPKADWPGFVQGAVGHGLVAYVEYESRGHIEVELEFRRAAPPTFSSGGSSLALSDEFYDYMKVADGYPSNRGGANGLVLLVHEPHWDVEGQFQLVPGMRALARTNPEARMQFLVEGEYLGDRQIGFNGLDKALGPAGQAVGGEPTVFGLVARYIVDGATAYRLLYDRKVKATAIDDQRYLPSTGRESVPAPRSRLVDAILAVLKAVDRAAGDDEKDKEKILAAFLSVLAYAGADTKDVDGELVVQYLDDLVGQLEMVARMGAVASEAGVQGLDDDVALVRSQVDVYKEQLRTFRLALQRDVTMAANIVAAARSRSDGVPVAFIGSFHTRGIARRLKEAGIGFLVVEPRHHGLVSHDALAAFDRALFKESRARYLQDALRDRKLAVLPTPSEVSGSIAPWIDREALVVQSRLASAASTFGGSSRVDAAAMMAATDANGAFARLRFESLAGQKASPVPGLSEAFAVFEPGRGTAAGRLLLDPVDARWADAGRYEFLRQARLPRPLDEDGVVVRSRAAFYPSRKDGRVYATWYDSASGRYFMFEGDAAFSALRYLTAPTCQ
jgi:hypothetical protein